MVVSSEAFGSPAFTNISWQCFKSLIGPGSCLSVVVVHRNAATWMASVWSASNKLLSAWPGRSSLGSDRQLSYGTTVTQGLYREAPLRDLWTATYNIEASIITYTILGVPYYNYSTIYPKTCSNCYILSEVPHKALRPLWHPTLVSAGQTHREIRTHSCRCSTC